MTQILAFFTNNGVPATGLSNVTLNIRDIPSGTLLITSGAMIEVGDGFYSYDFTTYDYTQEYSIRCNGGPTLPVAERFTYAGNENYVDDVAQAVWSEEISGYGSETAGGILFGLNTNVLGVSADIAEVNTNVLSVSADIEEVNTNVLATPGNVWEEEIADHTTAGTYGHELATKADLAASTSTSETVATTASIIGGDLGSGDYTETFVKDNTYWLIDENVTTGLTVEFTFYIPEGDRPGVIKTFGRYSGQPAGTHYMEIWVYNYEASAWEQLQEEFIPGGFVSDAEYIHEYFERNVDRDNNNEVKIRLIHNVTTYNATHELYLDYVAATSVDVVTAQEIATAVWSDTPSAYGNGTFGGLLQRMVGLMHENIYIDQPVYDSDGNLISARVRIYDDPSSVATAAGVIGTYQITAPSNAPGQFTSWKQIRTG